MEHQVNVSQPSNNKVVAYLSNRNPDAALILSPEESTRDPYMHLGSHPDIVERLWKGIGTELDADCRLIVCGTPALVQPATGIILAIALGTQYCLHLPVSLIKTALAAGASTTTKWSSGRVTNAASEFGEGWIFGKWLKDEIGWCRESYQVFGLFGK
jgi:hypothetical protein